MKRRLLFLLSGLFVFSLHLSGQSDAGVASINSPAPPDKCKDNTVRITLENTSSNPLTSATIHWSVNGVAQSQVNWTGYVLPQSQSGAPVTVGTYNFQSGDDLEVWVTDPNGGNDANPSNDLKSYSIPAYQTASLPGRVLLCRNSTIELNTEVDYANHVWNTGAQTKKITVSSAGQYRVTTTDVITGCEESYLVNVAAENPVRLPSSPVVGCDGDQVNLSTNLSLGDFTWSTNEQSNNIDVSSPGQYWVQVTDTSGTCTSSDTVDVEFLYQTEADFRGSIGYLTVAFTNQSTDATDYFWDFGDNSTSQAENPTRAYAVGGTYSVTLTASNDCFSDTEIKEFTVDTLNSTSIEEKIEKDMTFKVYPNPNAGAFNLEMSDFYGDEPLKMEVMDLQGRIIKSERINDISPGEAYRVSLDGVSKGLYLLKFSSGEEVIDVIRVSVK